MPELTSEYLRYMIAIVAKQNWSGGRVGITHSHGTRLSWHAVHV